MLNTYPCKHTERCGVSPPFVDHFPVSPIFSTSFSWFYPRVRCQKKTHEHPPQSKISKGSAWISLMQELGDVAANIQAVCSSIFGSEPDFSDTFLTNKKAPFPTNDGDWSWLVNVSFKHQLMKKGLVNVLIQHYSTIGERIFSKYLNAMLKKETAILNSMLPSL